MNLRRYHSPAIAGAKAEFSTASAYRYGPRLGILCGEFYAKEYSDLCRCITIYFS